MTRTTVFFLLAFATGCSSPPPRAEETPLPERRAPAETDEGAEDEIVEQRTLDESLGPIDAGVPDAVSMEMTPNVVVVANVAGAVTRFDDGRATFYEKSGALAIAGGKTAVSYVNVFAYGRAPGTYSCASTTTKASMIFRTVDGTYQGTSTMGSCTVTVTSIGVPGERLVGSFSSKLGRLSGTGPATIDVKGTFDVVRKADVK